VGQQAQTSTRHIQKQMTDCLADIFSSHLPSVTGVVAGEFAEGMRLYHELYKSYRDKAMNYEALPEYQNVQHCVMRVARDEFWPYSPHFRKAVALTIQELFKTKISSLVISPVSVEQMLVFVDEHGNRWIMILTECETDSCLNQISIFFPRANTHVCVQGVLMCLKQLNDPAFGKGNLALIVSDVAHWNQ
jgi:hypothetical protein